MNPFQKVQTWFATTSMAWRATFLVLLPLLILLAPWVSGPLWPLMLVIYALAAGHTASVHVHREAHRYAVAGAKKKQAEKAIRLLVLFLCFGMLPLVFVAENPHPVPFTAVWGFAWAAWAAALFLGGFAVKNTVVVFILQGERA